MKRPALVLLTLAATTVLADGSITDVPGIKVGSVTLTEKPTGCTVILAEGPPTAAAWFRARPPGSPSAAARRERARPTSWIR